MNSEELEILKAIQKDINTLKEDIETIQQGVHKLEIMTTSNWQDLIKLKNLNR